MYYSLPKGIHLMYSICEWIVWTNGKTECQIEILIWKKNRVLFTGNLGFWICSKSSTATTTEAHDSSETTSSDINSMSLEMLRCRWEFMFCGNLENSLDPIAFPSHVSQKETFSLAHDFLPLYFLPVCIYILQLHLIILSTFTSHIIRITYIYILLHAFIVSLSFCIRQQFHFHSFFSPS